jgi:hypothetical protein
LAASDYLPIRVKVNSHFLGRLGGAGFDGGDKSRSNPDGGGTVHEGSGDASNYDQRSKHQQTEKTQPAT